MIKLFTGPMGSGKSAYLIEEIKKLQDETNLIFKPVADKRSSGCIKSRNGQIILAYEVNNFTEILLYMDSYSIDIKNIFIDELQFLGNQGLKTFVMECKKKDINVYAAGLNLTSELNYFTTTAIFMCYCTDVETIVADCKRCGSGANLSEYTITGKKSDIVIGDTAYIATCDKCHKLLKL